MVSIRRPSKKANTGGLLSLFTIRNAVLAVIIFQSLNLASRVIKRTTPDATASGGDGKKKGIDEVYRGNLRKQKKKDADSPVARIEKVSDGGGHAQHKDTTDTDDHIVKPHLADNTGAFEKPKEKDIKKKKKDVPPPTPAKVVEKQKPPPEKKEEVKQPEQPAQKPKGEGGVDAKAGAQEALTKHGDGPTKLGYVNDLVFERQHPSYRNKPIIMTTETEEVGTELLKKVGEMALGDDKAKIKPCEYVENHKLQLRSLCTDAKTPLIAYNGANFPRMLCGKTIEPGKAIKLDEHCTEPAHMFPQDSPPISGKGMPPIVVQSQPGLQSVVDPSSRVRIEKCDIPCEYEKDIAPATDATTTTTKTDKLEQHYIAGTDWSISRTSANPYTNNEAKMERTAFRRDKYYSTTYLHSSVPLSHYCFDKYNLRDRPPIKWEDAANKATYLLDSKCTMGGGIRRHKWFAAVKASGFGTASYGSCDHDTELLGGETVSTQEGRVALAKKNRIHLAFEAGNENDYTSSVVWESLLSGAVPAILGARNAPDFLPPNSAIFTSSYNDWDKFAADVKAIAGDKEKWESYHKWRTDDKALAAFEKKFNFTRTSPECRTCRWAYAKMYGLGWDHEGQTVRDPAIQRKLCTASDNKLVVGPFREVWVYGNSKKKGSSDSSSCTTSTTDTSVELDGGYKIDRVVTQHDGVTDMIIKDIARPEKSSGDSLILRFKFDVKNTEGAYFPNTHSLVETKRGPLMSSASIQDEKAKVTVLANWETTISSPKEGIIEVVVDVTGSSDESTTMSAARNIRVITEDLNVVLDKITEFFPSSFGKLMTKDFVDPLELFYADSS